VPTVWRVPAVGVQVIPGTNARPAHHVFHGGDLIHGVSQFGQDAAGADWEVRIGSPGTAPAETAVKPVRPRRRLSTLASLPFRHKIAPRADDIIPVRGLVNSEGG
jgi:hypothetical protein